MTSLRRLGEGSRCSQGQCCSSRSSSFKLVVSGLQRCFAQSCGRRIGEASHPGPCEPSASAEVRDVGGLGGGAGGGGDGDYEARAPMRSKARGGKPHFMDIIVINTSGAPQLRQALDFFKKPHENIEAAAVLAQEHHAYGVGWADLQHKAKGAGWTLEGSQAASGEAGKGKAGTCIAFRSHVGSGVPAGCRFDESPHDSAGRIAASFVQGILRGGVLLILVYSWHSGGLTERNQRLLDRAGAIV